MRDWGVQRASHGCFAYHQGIIPPRLLTVHSRFGAENGARGWRRARGVRRRLGANLGQETGGPGVLDGSPSELLSECRCSLLDRQPLTWGYKRITTSSSHPGGGRAFPFSPRYAPKKQWLLPRARDVNGNQVCARPKDREAREQSVRSSSRPAARSNRG